MAFRTIVARYDGTCRRCGDSIVAGSRIRYGGRGLTYHLKADCEAGDATASEYRGRCEDAPCCGHSRCGFGPGSPGYGSFVGGMPYYGED